MSSAQARPSSKTEQEKTQNKCDTTQHHTQRHMILDDSGQNQNAKQFNHNQVNQTDLSQRFEITLEGETMGTGYVIKYIHESHLPVPIVIKSQIEWQFNVICEQMSTYHVDSCISQFNRWQETDKPFAIPEEFACVVKESIRLHELTCGGLDITLAPLIWLYGFGGRSISQLPDDDACQKMAQMVGMDTFSYRYDGTIHQLIKHHKDCSLDLSAIAKGFAVDKVAAYLEALAVRHYLIEIGGELFGRGQNLTNDTWRVGINNSADRQTFEQIVCLDGMALATSGNYQEYYQDELGRTFCHILHPIHKVPIQSDLASVSVIAPTTMMADGIATGLYALGAEHALQIANAHKLAVFLIIYQQNGGYHTKMTEQFRSHICPPHNIDAQH